MRVLRAADYRRMPWKNGGGVTTEIAVFPEGAGLDAFEWRLSMATVSSDGPFSLFPGVDRTLAVLEGEGIVLSVDGLPGETVARMSTPFAFPADRPASALLISGPITDLNVMTKRRLWKHKVERLLPTQSNIVREAGATAIVFCARGSSAISSRGKKATLDIHDAAVVDAAYCEIANSDGCELYVVTLNKLA